MPKMKTKRSAAKRFSFTGTGKVKRAAAYHRHMMTGKPTAGEGRPAAGRATWSPATPSSSS